VELSQIWQKKSACEIYPVASHNLQFFIADFWES